MLTALDQIANQNHLQLVKALLPYFPPDSQKTLSVCVKMMELQNVFRFYGQGSRCIRACAAPDEPPELIDVLSDIRKYCEDSEREMIDQCIQLISAMELYSMFAQDIQDPASGETSDLHGIFAQDVPDPASGGAPDLHDIFAQNVPDPASGDVPDLHGIFAQDVPDPASGGAPDLHGIFAQNVPPDTETCPAPLERKEIDE